MIFQDSHVPAVGKTSMVFTGELLKEVLVSQVTVSNCQLLFILCAPIVKLSNEPQVLYWYSCKSEEIMNELEEILDEYVNKYGFSLEETKSKFVGY